MRIELAAFLAFVAWIAIVFNLVANGGSTLAKIGFLLAFYGIGAAFFWGSDRLASRSRKPPDNNER
jgi:hypothetical protein